MVEIRTNIEAFKKIARKSKNPIFEAKDVCVTSINEMIVVGWKESQTKVFRKALPLLSLGYSGIASLDFGGICKEDKPKRAK